MNISWKIFIISYILFVLSIGFGSFYILNKTYQDDVNQIVKQAEEDNKSMYAYAVAMDTMNNVEEMESSLTAFANATTRGTENMVFVGDEEDLYKITGKIYVESNSMSSDIVDTTDGRYVQVISHIESTYMMNRYSLNEVILKREKNFEFYKNSVVVLSGIMAVILFLFSRYIASPIVKLTKMAEKVSAGDYSVNINSSIRKMKSSEVKKLGDTMNLMVVNTRSNIEELEYMIKSREEFVGNFTHEIKTPLTSIIGYGDMLRMYDLPVEKRREYGEYIYSEGKRLERLSANLLQLIVMNNMEVDFVMISATDLFEHIKKNSDFLKNKYGVDIIFNVENDKLKVESSLFITMILNLIDNACKASDVKQTVSVIGKIEADIYIINVIDRGKGIPDDEIDKIKEPFYMVDKSRARRQGGAGLGLALTQRIVDIHNGKMEIRSAVGEGTIVTIKLNTREVGQ